LVPPEQAHSIQGKNHTINVKDSGSVSVLNNETKQAKDVIETNLLKERLGPGKPKNSVERIQT